MIEVAAGVLARRGKVLICRRRWDGAHPGKWEFPGGKVEPAESLAECLRRELREELGVEAVVGAELWRISHQYPGRPPCTIAFVDVPAFEGEPENRCFAEMRWAALTELPAYDFLDADREFVRLLASRDGTPAPR